MRRLLLLSLLASTAVAADTSYSNTPWDVRRAAQELLDDLSHHRGEDAVLLERAQSIMAEHGSSLIAQGGGSAPICEVVAAKLKEIGLAAAFVTTFEPVADQRYAALGDHPRSEQLLTLARGYPGTATAAKAWSRLADLAWDGGELNAFVEYAIQAGDTAAPAAAPRRERVGAALSLLHPQAEPTLPPSLDGLSQIWSVPVAQRHMLPSRQGPNERVVQALAVCPGEGDISAASDGITLVVVDHLIGRLSGTVHSLGNQALSPRQCRPVALRNGFAAVGKQNNELVVVCVDDQGAERWRTATQIAGAVQNPQQQGNGGAVLLSVSAPVALDRLVLVGTTAIDEDNIDLQVSAFNAATGAAAWTTLVARIPGARRQNYGENTLTPQLCVHGGSALVLSNCGVLARVQEDGTVDRIWSYTSTTDEINAGMPQIQRLERAGAIMSDGTTAVVTPADNAGITLLLTGMGDPETYRGDGAGGDVIAAADGIAILLSQYVVCLDLASKSKRWDQKLNAALLNPQAVIGKEAVLVSSNADLKLLARKDGSVISERTFPSRSNLMVVDQSLVFGGTDSIAAYGGAAATIEEIAAEAKAQPGAFRPRVRLAALEAARGDSDASLASYLDALKCGAPRDYAERAASGVRDRLDLMVGDKDGFAKAITQLLALAVYDEELGAECAWWRARDAEARGDAAAAASGYRAVLQGRARLLQLRDGLCADLHLLAQGGLYRLKQAPSPLATAPGPEALPAAASTWSAPGHRSHPTMLAGGMIIGYVDGFLCANRVSDGVQAWTRKPKRGMLGIQMEPDQASARPDGLTIKVLPGTSAEAAGLKSDDVLQQFDDKPIHSFTTDLIPAVTALPPRSPYSITVLRGDQVVKVQGVLGGELVQAIAANSRTVLVGPMTQMLALAGSWIEALDLATGEKIATVAKAAFDPPTQRPANNDNPAITPLLTDDDVLIATDGDDLVGYQVHACADAGAGTERWRLAARGQALDHASLVGGRLLWLADPERGRGEIVDPHSGQTIASMPCEGEAPPVFDGCDAFARQGDLTVSCYDLASGHQRWRSARTLSVVLAAQSDAVYGITQEGDLAVIDRASGAVRRTFPGWSSVAPIGVVGDNLYLQLRDHDTDAVADVSLGSGTVLWQQLMPAHAEVQSMWPSSSGLTLLTRDGDSLWVLHLEQNGAIAGVAHVGPEHDHEYSPLAKGLLDCGSERLQVVPLAMPPEPPQMPAATSDGGQDIATAALALAPKLAWTDLGDGKGIALAHAGDGLLVFVKGDGDVVARIGAAGPVIDSVGMMLTFSAADVTFDHGGSDWRMIGQARLSEHGPLVARIDPPLGHPPLGALRIHVDVGGGHEAAPHWLMSSWQTVARAAREPGH